MRQISIDLTADRMPLATGTFVGYIGEHNATELLITIPQEMVDKSEYQILVFQSKPMVFRSNRVTEDKSKATYRDGNIIHTVLSKSLTRLPSLSLQVECYREDAHGEIELIGKTAVAPNLVLKPSPEGFPAYGYDGSFEDVDFAVLNAHRHDNLDVLQKFSTNSNGTLLYDGYAIGDSAIQKYATPSDLPSTAKVGVIAYAENDDAVPVLEDSPIKAHTVYNRLRFKRDIDPQAFNLVYQFAKRSAQDEQYGLAGTGYMIAREDETMMGGFSIVVSQYTLSIMMLMPKPFYTTKALYGKDERLRNLNSGSYMYSGIEIPNLYNGTVPQGWSFMAEKDGNFEFKYNTYYSDAVSNFYELEENDNLFSVYKNCGLIRTADVVDEELESEFLSAIFEIVLEAIKHKGLYIFTDTGWLPLEDFLRSNARIVNTFADLPEDCPVGTIAHVINNGYQVTPCTGEHTVIHGTVYPSFYFTPYPVDESFLFDFSIHGVYVDNTNPSNRVTYRGFIDIQSNLDEKYILVTHSNGYDTTESSTYIYSLEDQDFVENGKTYQLKKGWNVVVALPTAAVYIKAVTDFSELPKPRRGVGHDVSYGYLLTDVKINGSDVSRLPQFLFSTNSSFTTIDNGAGLWVKTESEWMKVENADEFLMQEVSF